MADQRPGSRIVSGARPEVGTARPRAPHVAAALQLHPAPSGGRNLAPHVAAAVHAVAQPKTRVAPAPVIHRPPSPVRAPAAVPPPRGASVQAKSKAKDLPLGDRPIELGSKMYLWQGAGNADILMVSAHGAAMLNDTIDMPHWLERLVFYVAHGESLPNPGLVLAQKDPIIYTHESKDDIPNYTLAKFQYGHSEANETYSDVLMAVAGSRSGERFDILTIRNRWNSKQVTFREVLNTLATHNYRYKEIHMNVCRSLGREQTDQDIELRIKDKKKQGYEMLD